MYKEHNFPTSAPKTIAILRTALDSRLTVHESQFYRQLLPELISCSNGRPIWAGQSGYNAPETINGEGRTRLKISAPITLRLSLFLPAWLWRRDTDVARRPFMDWEVSSSRDDSRSASEARLREPCSTPPLSASTHEVEREVSFREQDCLSTPNVFSWQPYGICQFWFCLIWSSISSGGKQPLSPIIFHQKAPVKLETSMSLYAWIWHWHLELPSWAHESLYKTTPQCRLSMGRQCSLWQRTIQLSNTYPQYHRQRELSDHQKETSL